MVVVVMGRGGGGSLHARHPRRLPPQRMTAMRKAASIAVILSQFGIVGLQP